MANRDLSRQTVSSHFCFPEVSGLPGCVVGYFSTLRKFALPPSRGWLCRSANSNRCFEGLYCLHLQGFYWSPEVADSTGLRKVGNTVWHHRTFVCLTIFYVTRTRIAKRRDVNAENISVVIWTSLVQQLAWDCVSKTETRCDNLTHSSRDSSYAPEECLSGHAIRHRRTGRGDRAVWHRQMGVVVSEEQTDSIFRAPAPFAMSWTADVSCVFQTFGPQWRLPCFIFRGYRRFCPGGYSGRVVKLPTHLHQMPILKPAAGSLHSPRPHGVHSGHSTFNVSITSTQSWKLRAETHSCASFDDAQ